MKLYVLGLAALAAASAQAITLYDMTPAGGAAETGFRYFPGAQTGDTSGTLFNKALDDVLIPTSVTPVNSVVDVTRVTFGIRRLANAQSCTITGYFAVPSDPPSTGWPLTNVTQFGAPVVLAANGASSVTQQVAIGDGVNTLFTVTPNYTALATNNLSLMAVGLKISLPAPDANQLNGWRIMTPNVSFLDAFWAEDAGAATPSNYVWFGGSPPAQFYMRIEGNVRVVPEPATMAALGMGALALIRRRRK